MLWLKWKFILTTIIRKFKRKMKKSILIIIGLMVILFGMLVFSARKPTLTGNVVREDVFEGIITNMDLAPIILGGTGVYDRSCNMVGSGLTQCDAGIQTEKGLLNFNYRHNMAVQRCIAEGDKLEVQILENNKARVRRI